LTVQFEDGHVSWVIGAMNRPGERHGTQPGIAFDFEDVKLALESEFDRLLPDV
jgi:hypothetical protein